ncbi:hypothetical protein CNR22_10050 [Sphingobacteriaceae bacterium]|nr:hypothetical protein CNR22_10050 [Sphingobacteriaceae bacterium]
MWQIKKDTVIKWYYHDGDEFNDSAIDKEKWQTSYSWTEVNYSFDFFMNPKQIQFENGVCKFNCVRDTGFYRVPDWQLDSVFKKKYQSSLVDGNRFKYYFSSGIVRSKRAYGKGYFEIRFKHDDSYGMWPAFWLYGQNKDEIDFFELKGERNNDIHVDVHCKEGCDHGYKGNNLFPRSFGGWIKTNENLKNGFNVVSGEWQDGYVKWYLNGVGIAYYKGEFATEKMHLITGTGPGKDGEPFSPGVNDQSYFPNSLQVDYVRIWHKQKNDYDTIAGKKHTSFDFVKSESAGTSKLKKKIGFMYRKSEFSKDSLTISVMPALNKKISVTSLGKKINYKITFYELSGTEILSKTINSEFEEFDFSNRSSQREIKVRIEAAQKILDETVTLH